MLWIVSVIIIVVNVGNYIFCDLSLGCWYYLNFGEMGFYKLLKIICKNL